MIMNTAKCQWDEKELKGVMLASLTGVKGQSFC